MSPRTKQDLQNRVASALVELKATGFSNKRAGDKIGVTENTIKNWIDGKTVPDSYQLQKIAEVTGKSIDWFYGEDISSYKVVEPSPSYGSDREIGRLEGRIESLEKEIEWYRTRVETILRQHCSGDFKNKHDSNTNVHKG